MPPPKRRRTNVQPRSSRTAPSAKFSDLPVELHDMIFQAVLHLSYGQGSEMAAKKVYSWLASLSRLNQIWRTIVQRTIFKSVIIHGKDLPKFIQTVKENPDLLIYIKNLGMRRIAGDSRSSPHGGVSARPTRKDRWNAFKGAWLDFQLLLSLVPQDKLKLNNLTISTNDTLYDLFNGEVIPQFRFVKGPAREIKHKQLPCTLKELTLESDILEHLELHPKIIRAVLDSCEGFEVLNLKTSDIRPYRPLRRRIYNGLVKTIEHLSDSHESLTTLNLDYPSSTGGWDYRLGGFDGVYALGDYGKNTDNLSSALHTLSQRLVNFRFRGRISAILFVGGGSNKTAQPSWPKLKSFSVQFDAVDSFGRSFIQISELDWESIEPCETCFATDRGRAYYYCEYDEPLIALIKAAAASPDGSEEGFDVLMCENCLSLSQLPKYSILESGNRIRKIFKIASRQMLNMPKISKWEFESACGTFTFSFDKEEYIANIGKYWKPSTSATKIWEGRFPGFTRNILDDDESWYWSSDSEPDSDGWTGASHKLLEK